MNLVSIATLEEFKNILAIIFDPALSPYREINGGDLQFEEITSILDVDESALLAYNKCPHKEDTDEWDDAIDNISIDDIIKYAITDGQSPLLKDFVPCCVMWHFEDSFDRMGNTTIRMFDVVPKAEMSPEFFIQRHKEYQEEREAEFKRWESARLINK